MDIKSKFKKGDVLVSIDGNLMDPLEIVGFQNTTEYLVKLLSPGHYVDGKKTVNVMISMVDENFKLSLNRIFKKL